MAKRRKGRFGFWGPFPSYTRRTRRGGSFRVTGCCLPLAIGLTTPIVALAALGMRSLVST